MLEPFNGDLLRTTAKGAVLSTKSTDRGYGRFPNWECRGLRGLHGRLATHGSRRNIPHSWARNRLIGTRNAAWDLSLSVAIFRTEIAAKSRLHA